MNKKITKSGKVFFANTMRMVNFSNRLQEENKMWRKYNKIKKRRLYESEDEQSDDNLAYENRHFKERDESMSSVHSSMKMDISINEANNLSNLHHLNESNVKCSKRRHATPRKHTSATSKGREKESSENTDHKSSRKTKIKNKSTRDDITSDSASSSEMSEQESDREECMVDLSFSGSSDDRLISKNATSRKSKTLGDKKIQLREKQLKKELKKLKKQKKKAKKKSKKSKKHKKSSP